MSCAKMLSLFAYLVRYVYATQCHSCHLHETYAQYVKLHYLGRTIAQGNTTLAATQQTAQLGPSQFGGDEP